MHKKYKKGRKKTNEANLANNRWAYSHQKIYLNSINDIPKFISLYCGIFLYKAKYFSHSISFNGGKIPVIISQRVMESPDSVNRVRPPTKIKEATKIRDEYNQTII